MFSHYQLFYLVVADCGRKALVKHCSPGNAAKEKKNEDPQRFSQVCLMLDGLAIRRQIQYDPHTQKMIDFVNLGDGLDETSVASEALVFMVVGLQDH